MSEFRAGFLGLVGLPNAGKSSFLNHILGETVSIVSQKPQATRKRVHGLWSSDKGQIVFVDSPGYLQKAKNPMTEYIAEEARQVLKDVDAALLLVPCDDFSSKTLLPLIEVIEADKKPWAICVTKKDQKQKDNFHAFLNFCEGKGIAVYQYSVRDPNKGDKREELLTGLLKLLPESPAPLYDPELYTTERVRDIAAEMIRERCFELLKQEIPFGLGVLIHKFEEGEKLLRIEASILVEKENHRSIVIGSKGSMLKRIGQEAREKIEKITGQKIYLGLHVSHKQNWTKQTRAMKDLGYEHE